MFLNNNIVSPSQEICKTFEECENDDDWLPILKADWDGHFQRYKELFINYCRRSPYHVKTSYRSGFVAKTRRRKDGGLYNPPLYDALADRLVMKHLDLYRYNYLYDDGLGKLEESWLGLRIGKRSKAKLIDIDNKHNIIGIYDGLFCDYARPIVNYTLADFQRLRRFYDQFPRQKWCISSATMGLHVWEVFPEPRTAEEIERLTRPRLKALGMGNCEVYPSPQLMNQCVRRPFGKDYYTLSGDGPIADWMLQLDYFESDQYPTFPEIVEGILHQLFIEWRAYDKINGLLVEANPQSPYVFENLVDTGKLRRDALKVILWMKQEFPIVAFSTLPLLCLKSVIKNAQRIPSTSPRKPVISVRRGDGPGQQAIPETTSSTFPLLCLKCVISDGPGDGPDRPVPMAPIIPWAIDLKDVNSGQWVESCVEWATNGLPGDDTLLPVVANLARWFYFVEFVDMSQAQRLDRVTELMQTFVANKHNGHVSTLNLGKLQDVMKRVARIVKRSIAKATEKDLFLRLVQKRRTGQYRTVYYLEPLITARTTGTSAFPLLCLKCVIREKDDSPLPPSIQQRLEKIAGENNMRKRGGDYPFVKFARRFLNAIWQGEGKAHINIETINVFMDRKTNYKDRHQQLEYKRLLAAHGFIHDNWERTIKRYERSALYRMTKATVETFTSHGQRTLAAG